jgi:hypothetical protein
MSRPSADGLTGKQAAAVAALLTERTVEAAAAKAGIAAPTLFRWLRDEAFGAAYRAARRAVVDSAIGGLQRLTVEAVGALQAVLTGAAADAVKVRAALGVLDMAFRGVELADLADRVAGLERQQEERRLREKIR